MILHQNPLCKPKSGEKYSHDGTDDLENDGFYYDFVVFLLSFRRNEMIKKVMQNRDFDQDPRYPFFHTHFKLLYTKN